VAPDSPGDSPGDLRESESKRLPQVTAEEPNHGPRDSQTSAFQLPSSSIHVLVDDRAASDLLAGLAPEEAATMASAPLQKAVRSNHENPKGSPLEASGSPSMHAAPGAGEPIVADSKLGALGPESPATQNLPAKVVTAARLLIALAREATIAQATGDAQRRSCACPRLHSFVPGDRTPQLGVDGKRCQAPDCRLAKGLSAPRTTRPTKSPLRSPLWAMVWADTSYGTSGHERASSRSYRFGTPGCLSPFFSGSSSQSWS